MFFIEDLQLTEDEQIILAGKRIGLGKKKQEKVDERKGEEEVKTVEKEKPVVKADKASLTGDDMLDSGPGELSISDISGSVLVMMFPYAFSACLAKIYRGPGVPFSTPIR